MGILNNLFNSKTKTKEEHQFKQYVNKEYDFSLQFPSDWKIVSENEISVETNTWWKPVRLVGPKRSQVTPYITVVTNILEDTGQDIDSYMDKAENDLMNIFSDFNLINKQKRTLLDWPTAWMKYTYRGDTGKVIELNSTSFFGREYISWFQFICESDYNDANVLIPIFEKVINSMKISITGLRYPDLKLTGGTECGICSNKFKNKEEPNIAMNLKLGHLIFLCDTCRLKGLKTL